MKAHEVVDLRDSVERSLDGGMHLADVLFAAKIEKWFVDEWPLMGGCARPDGEF